MLTIKCNPRNTNFLFLIFHFVIRSTTMMHYMLLFSRQGINWCKNWCFHQFELQTKLIFLFFFSGKLRLQKWNVSLSEKVKKKIARDLIQLVLSRRPKHCNFIDYKDLKIVYKRYASLYFLCAIENEDNELLCLEMIHRYVELLDKYFGSVCELDIIFNFEKAYFILDEFILGGEICDTSKKTILR